MAEFIRGITFKPDDVVPFDTAGSVVCMRTKNVQKELDTSDVWSVNESFVKRSNQLLRAGDILISSANSWNLVGKCCWVPQLQWPASFGGFVSVLRVRTEEVDSRFLFRWFSSDRVQSMLRSFGRQTTNISNLDIGRCLRLDLPLPPLPEQQQIVELLDRADALRATRREALARLDELVQSVFLDIFGDLTTGRENCTLAAVRDIVSEFRYGTSNKSQFEGFPALRIPNVTNGEIDTSDLKLV
ncbi:MAG: restriction endonuclease subunit S, partial [Pseudonocardiaceae bacterium]